MKRCRPTLANPITSSVGPLGIEVAFAVAERIERQHFLIAARELEAQLVDDAVGDHRGVRRGHHVVAAVERGGAAAGHLSAERLDVLVQPVAVGVAERQLIGLS